MNENNEKGVILVVDDEKEAADEPERLLHGYR
jgi:hypothetical protein